MYFTVTVIGISVIKTVRHCGLVGSAPAWDGTGCEFDSWQCRTYIPCSLSLGLLGSLRGSLGTYGLTQKLCLKKEEKKRLNCFSRHHSNLLSDSGFGSSLQLIRVRNSSS